MAAIRYKGWSCKVHKKTMGIVCSGPKIGGNPHMIRDVTIYPKFDQVYVFNASECRVASRRKRRKSMSCFW